MPGPVLTRLVLACALLAAAPPAPAGGPKPDPDAMRDATRGAGARPASPRAIGHYLEARRLWRAGDVDGAARELRFALAFDASSPELRVALARALLELGRIDGAAEEARAALAAGGSAATLAEAHVLTARVLLARRDAAGAVAPLREAMRLAAGEPVPDPEPWRLLADVQAAGGDLAAAEATLDDLARLRPVEAAAGHRELGRRALDEDAPARAERHLRRAASLDGGDPETFRLLAAALEALHRPREARDAHLAVLRLDPDEPVSLLALGRLALAADDPEEAREWFRRHVRASPDAADAYVRVAFEWLEDDRAAEALAAARAAYEEAPDPRLRLVEGLALFALRRFAEAARAFDAVPPAAGDVWAPARAGLGDALSLAGRHAEAERALGAALAARPGDARLVAARARTRVRAGKPAEAVRTLRAALAADPHAGGPDLAVALADALVADGKGDEALALLRAEREARPRDADLGYAIASVLERLGRHDEALAEARAVLALEPEHVEALNFVAYVLAEQGASLDEAERLAREALARAPRAGHVHDTLGWVLHRKGDAAGALAAIERALALSGPDPVSLDHLGDVHAALGRRVEAARAWRDAIREPGDGTPSEEVRRRRALEGKIRALGAPRPDSLTPAAARR